MKGRKANMTKKDTWEKHAGDFKNEAELEEEVEADMLEKKKVEEEHFEEDELN